jgi:ankyrin repeat protein
MAAWNNSSKSVEVLIELGAAKDEVNANENTALFIAALGGFLEIVKVLVEAGCEVSPAAANGKTAIYAAARSGKLSVLLCIMRSQSPRSWKALVNMRSNHETPIHGAMYGGNAEIVKFLLDAGADGAANGILESSPLHYAADGTVNGILKSSPLHHAAHDRHNAMSSHLLKHTKNPNPRNGDGDTPLHFAVRARNFDFIVKFFQDCSQLGLSIEIDAQNNDMETALKVALQNGFEKGAKYLLEKG